MILQIRKVSKKKRVDLPRPHHHHLRKKKCFISCVVVPQSQSECDWGKSEVILVNDQEIEESSRFMTVVVVVLW